MPRIRPWYFFCDTERDSKKYWSIKRTVIKKIKEADPASFRMMSDAYLARDKTHLFRQYKIVPVQDIDSFVLLGHAFSRDKLRGYFTFFAMHNRRTVLVIPQPQHLSN
ncbi:DKNYY domain-containing protein [Undibacterium sp. Di26W]|uniref:DKNYY domain-containing protein n=1 Tax=Undibacterium sp. Di26W TaxID=3413035 RepID=UPI003BF2D615